MKTDEVCRKAAAAIAATAIQNQKLKILRCFRKRFYPAFLECAGILARTP
jgi:hypothetical protein